MCDDQEQFLSTDCPECHCIIIIIIIIIINEEKVRVTLYVSIE